MEIMSNLEKGWETLSSDYLINTEWIKVRRDVVKLPNECILDDYFVVEKKDVALIVAVDSEDNIILKEEYRYPINEVLIELPGGTLQEDEDSIQAAKRELKEETGYVSDEWQLLACNYDYPTKDTNTVYIYLARNIKKISKQKLDISEDIKYKLVPLDEALEMCRLNSIKVNGTITGILLATERIK